MSNHNEYFAAGSDTPLKRRNELHHFLHEAAMVLEDIKNSDDSFEQGIARLLGEFQKGLPSGPSALDRYRKEGIYDKLHAVQHQARAGKMRIFAEELRKLCGTASTKSDEPVIDLAISLLFKIADFVENDYIMMLQHMHGD